ncbi:hypothetical protein BACCELL_04013 [Bacteroides cellulosilyticus DSM 14838]|uniref:Uncharacterized protein n=1 Tax=Bacteroides cellulosilyticus DSM 14838 TaxID=537012 RepID=E2NI79_9BACE|nr:hypothetical protein BACCELL_04013 [Bacteroides cellulosilyticus DSM 14838]
MNCNITTFPRSSERVTFFTVCQGNGKVRSHPPYSYNVTGAIGSYFLCFAR